MKHINYYKLLVIPLIILIALLTSLCTPRESQVDSKEVADEKNLEKFTTREARQDAKTVTSAVAYCLAEIRLADLAIEKTRDEELKNIALHLKNDYAMLLADLRTYAGERVITVPSTEENSVRAKADKLRNEAIDFNKKWCEEVLELHKDAIANLEDAKDKASDADLRAWANNTLPRVRRNLDLVSACHNRVK
ncbi:MAG TPA: DUF4142 domain-containing protein [Cyclobacteriaceae bacterium]|nr:DUF4142 domain-containing protein [Cyclobacteriaceae bacterium]HMV10706.1 DUF4142 domain-containing protein [Cyclobacteriaceae bacterium]HMV91127.1 DUF4142 domain-containing protein [Cyclobacteriaceae bacterium]HMX00055.1 DUF4142 domain-containing protein [Cyclobacteriaceae bacterium]HMX49083.1 DUF4142 domain-containing protein [Cyclobacteriaceae bacterium]